jgi:hypothetical protein
VIALLEHLGQVKASLLLDQSGSVNGASFARSARTIRSASSKNPSRADQQKKRLSPFARAFRTTKGCFAATLTSGTYLAPWRACSAQHRQNGSPGCDPTGPLWRSALPPSAKGLGRPLQETAVCPRDIFDLFLMQPRSWRTLCM